MLFAIALFGSQSPNSTFLATDRSAAGYGFGLDTMAIALTTLASQIASVVAASLHSRVAARIGLHRTIAAGATLLAMGTGCCASCTAVVRPSPSPSRSSGSVSG